MMVSRGSAREKIKPVWFIFSSRWGGPEQVAMSDMADMATAGIPVTLCCLDGSPIHAAAIRRKDLMVRPIPTLARGRWDFQFIRTLRTIVDDVGANIVQVNDEDHLWYLVPALHNRSNVSIVVNRYTLARRERFGVLRRLLARRLDYMAVLGESVKNSVLVRGAIPEKKVRVINLGLDFSRFDPAKSNALALRQSWGAGKETVVIGSVGRLTPEVGQATFIKAAAGLLKHLDWKLRFVIVGEEPLGSNEEYLNELRELVRIFHIEESVVFSSLGENLPDVMAAFDIFVMPGREEVPGLGALEALAMERPVVLSNVVGAHEIVGNKEFGLLVRPDDAFDLQFKILELLKNPSHRMTMGSNGRAHVLRHFDKKTRFVRTLDLYERCIKRRYSWSERSES